MFSFLMLMSNESFFPISKSFVEELFSSLMFVMKNSPSWSPLVIWKILKCLLCEVSTRLILPLLPVAFSPISCVSTYLFRVYQQICNVYMMILFEFSFKCEFHSIPNQILSFHSSSSLVTSIPGTWLPLFFSSIFFLSLSCFLSKVFHTL